MLKLISYVCVIISDFNVNVCLTGPNMKPCSFFMEGNCRRSDCKFAHDMAKITCRFWEEGACFKGPTCPFLHGYQE